MNTTTTTAHLGRNVGNAPMSSTRWHAYQVATREAIRQHANTSGTQVLDITHTTGTGVWEGASEDCAVISVTTTGMPDMETLTHVLAGLANDYDQDAIALAHGPSVLIGRAS